MMKQESGSLPKNRRAGEQGLGASLRTQRPTTFYENNDEEQQKRKQMLIPTATRPERAPGRKPVPGSSGRPIDQKRNNNNNNNVLGSRSGPGGTRGVGVENEKSKISTALLNKRQSVSYGSQQNNSSSFKNSHHHHPLPTIPPGFEGAANRTVIDDDRIGGLARGHPTNRSVPSNLDFETLSQDRFDPEQFMKIHLITLGDSSDPETLRMFKNSLRAARLETNRELQENAYKNYSAFVAISKEMAALESDMLELKSALEEFKTLPIDLDMGLRNAEEAGSSVSNDAKRRAGRNSIADVNALYRSQLEALWENVEGSQKFLPSQPGRHIITESNTCVELNPITYQPKQSVHLFLLSDSLLLAVSKRTGIGAGKRKLIADRFFQLTQIQIISLADSPDLTNAIQIKANRETVVLKTARADEKRVLLNSFKKVAEEMANKKRKQSIMEAEQRRLPTDGNTRQDGYFNSTANLSPTEEDFDPIGSSIKQDFHPTKNRNSINKDLSWIEDISDELSVCIACREYERSIELIDKLISCLESVQSNVLRKTSSKYSENDQQFIKNKIEEKTNLVLIKLNQELKNPNLRKTQLIKTIQFINKLCNHESNGLGVNNRKGIVQESKESFLKMRSLVIQKQLRLIKFEGDSNLWICQSSLLIFNLIKNTCEWYMTAFRDNQVASGFVKWAVEEIEKYSIIFKKQVFGDVSENEEIMKDSLNLIKLNSSILKEVGLDFSFLIESILLNPIKLRINNNSIIRNESFDLDVIQSTKPLNL